MPHFTARKEKAPMIRNVKVIIGFLSRGNREGDRRSGLNLSRVVAHLKVAQNV